MRLLKKTGSALAGLALSTTLAGCAHRAAEPVAPEPLVVVRTIRETPPAELTRCPVAPAGLPAEGAAEIPPAWRAAIIRLAKGYADVSGQLGRLIAWETRASC